MKIIFENTPGPEDLNFFEQKLLEFNRSIIHPYGYEDFIIKHIDESKSIQAGLHGQTGSGWLYISSLWVHEKFRNQGMGKKLVLLAEDAAIKKDCHGAYLYTYSFQSPDFYKKLGYEVFGTLENFCDTHTKLYMKKELG